MSEKQSGTVSSLKVAPYSSESAKGQAAERNLYRGSDGSFTLKMLTRDPEDESIVTSMVNSTFSEEEARELKNDLERLLSDE